ncbi:MAG: hypothetical protein IH989_08800 [Planctomycetes bacterium]|nr:hypothetical protein [Planctomycetota bacterium]
MSGDTRVSIPSLARYLGRALADFERDYATKEEWLRECTIARGTLERLKESTVRIETRLESGCARGALEDHSCAASPTLA